MADKWPWTARPRAPAPRLEGEIHATISRGLAGDPVELAELTALLCSGVPEDIDVSAVWTVNGSWCSLNLDHPECKLNEAFFQDGQQRAVKFAAFLLAGHRQNQGAATRMLRNSLIAYDMLKVTYVGFYANFDIGGYTWAKMGGMARDAELERSQLIARLRQRREQSQIAADEGDRLESVIADAHPERLMHETACTIGDSGDFIGKSLLLGHKWDGYFDLTNDSQRSILAGALANG